MEGLCWFNNKCNDIFCYKFADTKEEAEAKKMFMYPTDIFINLIKSLLYTLKQQQQQQQKSPVYMPGLKIRKRSSPNFWFYFQ